MKSASIYNNKDNDLSIYTQKYDDDLSSNPF